MRSTDGSSHISVGVSRCFKLVDGTALLGLSNVDNVLDSTM